MIKVYYKDKKLKNRLPLQEADIIKIKNNNFDLMFLAQRMRFLQYGFQMTAIALVSVINHYHINGLNLFWDTLLVDNLSSINNLKKNILDNCDSKINNIMANVI